MFKVKKKDTEQRYWRRSGIFIVNFEQISHLFLVFLLVTLKPLRVCWHTLNFQSYHIKVIRYIKINRSKCSHVFRTKAILKMSLWQNQPLVRFLDKKNSEKNRAIHRKIPAMVSSLQILQIFSKQLLSKDYMR